MLVALGWGLLAASSLILGAALGVLRDWNQRFIGVVLGFGAGALVASISFELAEEGFAFQVPCRYRWALRSAR